MGIVELLQCGLPCGSLSRLLRTAAAQTMSTIMVRLPHQQTRHHHQRPNNGLDRVACDILSSSTSPPPPPSSPMFKKTSPTSSQSAALNDFETGCQAKDNFPLL